MSHHLIQELVKIAGNERSCPILLPYQQNIISKAEKRIKAQEQRISEARENIQALSEIEHKFLHIMELEILRWKYLIRVYHSTRLKKIQELVEKLIIPNKDELCEVEWEFCLNFQKAFSAALGDENVEFTSEEKDMSPFVFFKALTNIGPRLLSDSETNEVMDISENSINLARLHHVIQLVDENNAAFI